MMRSISLGAAFLILGGLPAHGLAAEGTASQKVEQKVEAAKEAAQDTAGKVTRELDDTWITLKTKLALLADERVSAMDVKVATEKGEITLRGKVDSEAARQAAEEIALNIKGQQRVINQLAVVPKAARKVVDRRDDQIAKDVERQLKGDARLKQAAIDARADRGIVTLTGTAPSLEASVRASEVARRVPGVRAVRNELALERQG